MNFASWWVENLPALVSGGAIPVLGYLSKVAFDVSRWVKAQAERNEVIDAIAADWLGRGLTPEGAIRADAERRDQIRANTAALAHHDHRLDQHHELWDNHDARLSRVESVTESLGDRLDAHEGSHQ